LRKLAGDRDWAVAAEFQDVGTGRGLKERPGLMAAIRMASENKLVEAVLVHRVDRLARNVYSYLTLKTKLRQAGVRIVSYVEHFDANPMGEFLEHVMAAQAEFYSANLSMEVKKGMEERLRRGRWSGVTPIGYLREKSGRLVLDPARSPLIQDAFDMWASGEKNSTQIAREIHARGLVSQNGGHVRGVDVCRILKNPFYAGQMLVKGVLHPAIHPPLITMELFDRCQEIFRQRRTAGRPRGKLTFLLSGKLLCPRCGKPTGGEEHRKPSGLVFRYYRCKRPGCGYTVRTEEIDKKVIAELLALDVPSVVPILRRQIRETMKRDEQERAERIQKLRADRERTRAQHAQEAEKYFTGKMEADEYSMKHDDAMYALRVTDRLIAEEERGLASNRGDRALLSIAKTFRANLLSEDPVERREAIEATVDQVWVVGSGPRAILRPEWHDLLESTTGAAAAA
jgi:DNA invertase Pin-like site-specific DNA recombinase/uncharacterized Zn finger protein (UPF0148 family)